MTPQEAKLIDELFDRLASLENAPRDPEAVGAINDGLRRAPNALYPLVQTVLVQDEALKRADARIRDLEGELGVEPGQPAQQGSFLDNMRDALLGKPQSSVPSVRPAATAPAGPWRTTSQQGGYGQQGQQGSGQQGYGQQGYGQQGGYGVPPQAQSGGSSFLGTAAATAAGVVGGAMLMNSMRGLFGGQGQAHGAFDPGLSGGGTPWGPSAGDSNLAREAGIDNIGHGGGSADHGDSQRAGLFDTPSDDSAHVNDVDDDSVDAGGDFGGDDGSSEA
jgi:hypothetical protein